MKIRYSMILDFQSMIFLLTLTFFLFLNITSIAFILTYFLILPATILYFWKIFLYMAKYILLTYFKKNCLLTD